MEPGELQALLLPALKNYRNITWDDTNTDNKVWEMAQSGMAYINDKAGQDCDFVNPGRARTLLLDYVRYMRDDALDIFESNYLHLILDLQNFMAVKEYEQSQTTDTAQQ